MKPILAQRLWRIRDHLDLLVVITRLEMPTKLRGTRVAFRCPQCRRFNTALSQRSTNLGRCFPCHKSFNTIDLVTAERGWSFLDAVRYLESILDHRTHLDCRVPGQLGTPPSSRPEP